MDLTCDPGAITSMLRQIGTLSRPSSTDVLVAMGTAMKTIGFRGIRYYQVGDQKLPGVPREHAVYLTWQEDEEHSADIPIGFPIPWSDTTLSHQEEAGPLRPVVESDYPGFSDSSRPWLKALKLTGKSWVDVPVCNHSALIGLLAADWAGPPADLTDRDLDILTLLGSVLGSELTATSHPSEARLQDRLLELYASRPKHSQDLVVEAAKLVRQELNAAAVAVFRFSWARQELRRVYIEPDPPPEFTEEAYLVGENLTGLAWKDSQYRGVLDFDALSSARPELVNAKSLDAHQAMISGVHSVMYGAVGEKDPSYLLRVINNSEHPELPFKLEQDIFGRFINDLNPVVDSQIASERAAKMSRVVGSLAARKSPDALIQEALVALREVEDVRKAVVISHREGESEPYLIKGIPPHALREVRKALLNDPDYHSIVYGNPEYKFSQLKPQGLLHQVLEPLEPQVGHVAGFPFASGMTRGVVLIPIRSRQGLQHAPERPSAESRRFIGQLASAVGQALESSVIGIQSQQALRALSLVGHEMLTPLAAVNNLTQHAIFTAKAAAGGSGSNRHPVSGTFFDDLRKRVQDQTDTLQAAVQLGHLVGRQSNRQVVGFRRVVGAREMINRAILHVRQEIARGQLWSPLGISFAPPRGNTTIRIACDRPLVEAALSNIFRNAAKYSLDHPRGIRVWTDVERQGAELRIIVTNLGSNIPDYQQELIFEPFVRVAGDEPDIARRGMGLGLFLARQIARAHGGDVELMEHISVGSGPGRGRDKKLWRTRFALRIRCDLEEGPYRSVLPEGPRDDDRR